MDLNDDWKCSVFFCWKIHFGSVLAEHEKFYHSNLTTLSRFLWGITCLPCTVLTNIYHPRIASTLTQSEVVQLWLNFTDVLCSFTVSLRIEGWNALISKVNMLITAPVNGTILVYPIDMKTVFLKVSVISLVFSTYCRLASWCLYILLLQLYFLC